jgi:uncharacterized cupredoxin-like copper-binding protein
MEEINNGSKNVFLIIIILVFLGVGALVLFPQLSSLKIGKNYQQADIENNENNFIPEPQLPNMSSVKNGVVVTSEGKPVKNDVVPSSPEAPQQSAPIKEEEAPADSIKVKMTASGITPSEFSVKAGELVTLVVTSGDQWAHVFKFKDKSLSAVATGLAPGETRSIVFNAPSEKGEYEIFCDIPGHEARGEKAKMIVR